MIVNDHVMVRLGIRRLIEPGWEVEEIENGSEAIGLLRSVGSFDVAIVEMRPAQEDAPSGADTIRRLLREQPSLGVIAHGGRIEHHAHHEADACGAAGYVSRRAAPALLLEAIEAAGRQESFSVPSTGSALGGRRLTRRQREVLQLFANGHSTDDVAKRLGVSADTIRTHAKASLSRLGARDRSHAIAIALRGSLIE